MEIGPKIKRLRIQLGLTQEELANRCELSKGFISQLERDLTSPSIATLIDILECLGTSPRAFFSDDSERKCVYSRDDMFELDDEEHGHITWLVPNAQKNEMEPILVALGAGQSTQKQDPHEGEEFGYVLDGSVILECDGERSVVRRGETFYLHGRTFHYLKNERKTTARILWVCTPPLF